MTGWSSGAEPAARWQEGSPSLEDLSRRLEALERTLQQRLPNESVSLVCFSGEWDRLYAAFILANGALAMGQEVDLYFTFWAAMRMRRQGRSRAAKFLAGKLLQAGPEAAPLSRMNLAGLGKLLLRRRMRKLGVDPLEGLIQRALELGARFHLCELSAALMGFHPEEMVGGRMEACGAATFLSTALKSRIVLFI
jgi:peroxiredoxin family protein